MIKKIYLTGYERETVKEFLTKLKKQHITTVIDIRAKPLSRKNGFSKNILRKILNREGISYFHFEELGAPEILRNELKEENGYLNFFQKYRKYVHNKPQLIKRLLKTIYENGRSTLLCFEKNYELCHRSIVASELLKCDPNLQIIPL